MSEQIIEGSELPEVDFKYFLENTPPNHAVFCPDFSAKKNNGFDYPNWNIEPELYCSNDKCMGVRRYYLTGNDRHLDTTKANTGFIEYTCRNCGITKKSYAFIQYFQKGSLDSVLSKVGEAPKFGKRVPEKVNKLIKSERDLFFKGMANENQGMGIGAFGYYRRVLDAQKNRIFDKIIDAVKVLPVDKKIIEELESAKSETQFTKAVDSIKSALPEGLLIKGHNPLKLLYKAVSEGLHNHTDEECLEYAQHIRVILFEFAERLDTVLKDNREVANALDKLLKIK